MSNITSYIIATFTVPERIGITPESMLWLLPLVAAIAIVYKATKIQNIKAWPYIKEVTILFGTIVIFMTAAALVLFAILWLVTE
jgi:hypothetical protein